MDTTQPPAVPAAAKPWWQSRTLIFNALVAALASVEAMSGPLQALVGPAAFPSVLMAVAMLNAVLRVITSQRIGK